MRDGTKIGANPRRCRRVLRDLTRKLRNVNLFAVRPGVLPERTQIAKERLNGPLIDLLELLDTRVGDRLSGPRRGRAPHHLWRDFDLLLARIGVHNRFPSIETNPIDGTPIERV